VPDLATHDPIFDVLGGQLSARRESRTAPRRIAASIVSQSAGTLPSYHEDAIAPVDLPISQIASDSARSIDELLPGENERVLALPHDRQRRRTVAFAESGRTNGRPS
jgi:hypothetical protein